jgi:hypothetical protein
MHCSKQWLVVPATRQPAAKTQMFVDFLAERLKGERL